MTQHWAIELSVRNVHRAGELRLMAGIRAASQEDVLWLRGEGLDEAIYHRLAPLADGPVFRVDDSNRLTPFGHSVPVRRLPDLAWTALADLLVPELPVARVTAFRLPRDSVHLVRSASEQPPAMLLTNWASFESWALSAPGVRIHVCQFAVCHNSKTTRVAVRANPLPPLIGPRFWLAGCVAVPLGFEWAPRVDAETLCQVMEKFSSTACVPEDDLETDAGSRLETTARAGHAERPDFLWVWQENGRRERIDANAFVPASRTNVRATSAHLKSSLPTASGNRFDLRQSSDDGENA